VYKYLIL